MQIRLLFDLKSHAPCATERQCLVPKMKNTILFVTEMIQICSVSLAGEMRIIVQIRSVTIFLFALIVLLRDG